MWHSTPWFWASLPYFLCIFHEKESFPFRTKNFKSWQLPLLFRVIFEIRMEICTPI
jgi:hypothetical protein